VKVKEKEEELEIIQYAEQQGHVDGKEKVFWRKKVSLRKRKINEGKWERKKQRMGKIQKKERDTAKMRF
jgi:hypothetical protein